MQKVRLFDTVPVHSEGADQVRVAGNSEVVPDLSCRLPVKWVSVLMPWLGQRLARNSIGCSNHLARPHQKLNGDTPISSAKPEPAADGSRLVSIPVVGGLHHRYIRVAA